MKNDDMERFESAEALGRFLRPFFLGLLVFWIILSMLT